MGLYARQIARTASRIDDPIERLRFLRAAGAVPGRYRRWASGFALQLLPIALAALFVPTAAAPTPNPIRPIATKPAVASDVWMVEKTAEAEDYSNGLRIDNHYMVTTHSRSWLAFPAAGGAPEHRTQPAGIVFHTTESRQVPFEAEENQALRRTGESLLEFVGRLHAYNFVIDRFGRVYRVVPEDQAANHAGHSVWADANWLYVDLNRSFLGIAFEAQGNEIGPAQVRSGARLIEMLRHRFPIPDSNFVTHAQVSVNPSNMRVGWHVDWASGFPFEEIGLADTYREPLPAIWAFGFDCDEHFTRGAGTSLRDGVDSAKEILAEQATNAGLRPSQYRKKLRERYRALLRAG